MILKHPAFILRWRKGESCSLKLMVCEVMKVACSFMRLRATGSWAGKGKVNGKH